MISRTQVSFLFMCSCLESLESENSLFAEMQQLGWESVLSFKDCLLQANPVGFYTENWAVQRKMTSLCFKCVVEDTSKVSWSMWGKVEKLKKTCYSLKCFWVFLVYSNLLIFEIKKCFKACDGLVQILYKTSPLIDGLYALCLNKK